MSARYSRPGSWLRARLGEGVRGSAPWDWGRAAVAHPDPLAELTAAELERIAEGVRKERDRVYEELVDSLDEMVGPLSAGRTKMLRLKHEDLRAEFKLLWAAFHRAKEAEERAAALDGDAA